MANRKATVLNPAGYQEQLPDDDNLLLTAAPSDPSHGTNKGYVDSADQALQAEIDTTNTNLATEISDRTDADSNLQDQIDLLAGGSLDGRYVERAGDDMTGNLTLGTDKITLNATSGNASFTGQVSTGALRSFDANETVRIKSGRATGDLFTVWNSATSVNDGTKVATIFADGGANFDGALEAASIDGGTY